MPLPPGLHAPLAHRKVVQARVRVQRILSQIEAATPVEQRRDETLGWVLEELVEDRPQEGVDELICRVGTRLRSTYGKGTEPRVLQLIDDLVEAEATPVRCGDCDEGLARCDGTALDDALVHNDGLCMQEVRSAFEAALSCARRLYGKGPANDLELVVLASRGEEGTEPYLSTLDVFLDAETFTGTEKSHRFVAVLMRAAAVEPQCLVVAWPILYRECLASAFADHGWRLEERPSAPCLKAWMEWVAFQLLLRDLREGAVELPEHVSRNDVEDAICELTEARVEDVGENRPSARDALCGYEAAAGMLAAFESCLERSEGNGRERREALEAGDTPDRAERGLADFSVAMNRVSPEEDEGALREAFVIRASREFRKSRASGKSRRDRKGGSRTSGYLSEVAKEFLASRDALTAIRRVNGAGR